MTASIPSQSVRPSADDALAPYAALILRLTAGVAFIAHGLLKVLVFTPSGTVAYFQALGLPGELAYLVIAAEILGGAALIAGVYTRLVSLALIPVLIGAALLGHGANGWLFSNDGGGWEFPAFWAAAMVVQALLGDGAYALSARFKATPQAATSQASTSQTAAA